MANQITWLGVILQETKSDRITPQQKENKLLDEL
jgi:hypothetical protein